MVFKKQEPSALTLILKQMKEMKIYLCFIKWWVQPAADIETVRFHYCQARTWDGLQRRLMIYLIHSVSVNLDQCCSALASLGQSDPDP